MTDTYEYLDIFKARPILKGKVKGTDTIVYFEKDPLTGKLLRDPYYAEHEQYRIAYNHQVSQARAGLISHSDANELSTQPGPQWYFLRNEADVIIYGGAAGAGKTYSIVLNPLTNMDKERFNHVIFRRTKEDLKKSGGPLDEAKAMYAKIPGMEYNTGEKEFTFPILAKPGEGARPEVKGMNVRFEGLEHIDSVLKFQGAQIESITFDELTHFEESQFTYMMTRNRTGTGLPHKCTIKATTNPETGSWVRKWLDWYLWPFGSVYPQGYKSPTGEDVSGQECGGLPIRERSGKITYYIYHPTQGTQFRTTKKELQQEYPHQCMQEGNILTGTDEDPVGAVKSFTFISASVYDNPKMLMSNPGYISSLKNQPKHITDGLLGGNWDSTSGGGLYFKREWITEHKGGSREIDRLPNIPLTYLRYWDRAATEPSLDYPDPDWTVGARMAKDHDGNTYIISLERDRKDPGGVEGMMEDAAARDGIGCPLWVEQDPGSGGKSDVSNVMRKFRKYPVHVHRPTKDKLTKGLSFSSACQNGLVYFVKGQYLNTLYHELETFDNDGKKKDDQWDSVTGGYNQLAESNALVFQIDDPNEGLSGDTHFTETY
jgi:predicted phage terminase large subunit-like protein